MARKRDGNIIVCISNHHQGWLSDLCRDFNSDLSMLDQAPAGLKVPKRESYLTPCGEEFFDPILVSNHVRFCDKCKSLAPAKAEAPKVAAPKRRGRPLGKSRSGKARTVAKLEPGMNYDLNGVISSIEIVRDRMWEKCEFLDNLIINLKNYRDDKEKITELSIEASQRVDAVELLLRDGKLPH